MISRWFNGLDTDERKDLEREFNSSVRVREKIVEILKKDLQNLYASLGNEKDYESPSWPYIQADKLGEAKALKKLITLFEN